MFFLSDGSDIKFVNYIHKGDIGLFVKGNRKTWMNYQRVEEKGSSIIPINRNGSERFHIPQCHTNGPLREQEGVPLVAS